MATINLNTVIKLLPLATVIVIGLGILKASVYYGHFGVDIISYLDTSDVLTLFLTDYDSLIILLCLGFVHYLITDHIFEELEKTEFGEQIFEKVVRNNKWKFFIFFFILDLILCSLIKFSITHLANWNIYLIAFCNLQLVAFFFITKTGQDIVKNVKLTFFFVSITIIAVIPMLSLKEAFQIHRNEGKKIILLSDNERICSSYNNPFLGKAGEYYFFWNRKNGSTTAYPAGQIDKTIFLQKNTKPQP